MSGSVSGPNYSPAVLDPLTVAERVDARRYCGYPAYGSGSNDDYIARFSVTYVELEYHLSALTDPELIVVRAKLAELAVLDTAIPASGANLDSLKASVWSWNPNEVRDRNRLFDLRRRALCDFLGVPPGPSLSRGSGTSVRFIV